MHVLVGRLIDLDLSDGMILSKPVGEAMSTIENLTSPTPRMNPTEGVCEFTFRWDSKGP